MLRQKWLRVLILSVAGLVASVIALLLAVYFILKSPAMQQKIIHSLQAPLAKEGVDLELRSLAIDLVAGVHLEGLRLVIRRAPLVEGTLGVDDLRLGYAIWPLLNRRLEIRQAKLVGISGNLNVILPPPVAAEPPPDPEALSKILDILRHPPATLDLPELALEQLTVHLNLVQGPMTVDLSIDNMNLKSSVALNKGSSALTLDGSLPLRVKLAKGEDLGLETTFLLEPHLTWASTLEKQQFKWNLDVDDTTIKMGQTHFSQGKGQLLADVKDLYFKLKLGLKHDAPVPNNSVTVTDIALPLSTNGTINLDAGPGAFADQKSKSQGVLSAKADINFDAALPSRLKKPEDLSWTVHSRVELDHAEIFQAKQKVVAVPQVELKLDGKGAEGKGDLDLEVNARKVVLKALQAALTIESRTAVFVDLPKKGLDLKSSVKLNQKPAMTMAAKVSDTAGILAAKLALAFHTYSSWKELHKGIGQLDQLGWPSVQLTSDLNVLHPEPLEDTKDWTKLTITNKLAINVEQSPDVAKALVKFKELTLKLDSSTQDKKTQGQLLLQIDRLQHKALRRPIGFEQNLAFSAQFADLLSAEIKGTSKIDGKERIDLHIEAQESPKRFELKDQVTIKIDPSLKQYLAGLDVLDDVGQLKIETKDVAVLSYPQARIKDVKDWNPSHIIADVQSQLRLSQDGPKVKYRILVPMDIQTQAKLANDQLAVVTRLHAPSVEARDLATVTNLDSRLDVKINSINSQDRVDVQILTGIKGVKPLMASAEKVQDLVQNLTFRLKAQVLQKDKFFIQDLGATVDGALLSVKGKGDMALSTGRGGFVGNIRSQLPPGRSIAGLKGTGGFELPFSVTLYDKKVLALQSEPHFDKLSFDYGDIQVEGMDGKFSLAEELSIDDKGRIEFLYLNTQNPFTRVDFENIDPYLGQRLGLAINKVRFKHIITGPMLANIELRQNLILLNEMKANLLNGSALGRVFVDLHPERLQLGFLGRFSNLQLELLKEPSRRQKRDDELSGRAAANFDIKKRLASGRIDVTSIGRNQLLSMIDVLDPGYRDTQMMAARRALQIAYPSLVSISMEQGLMDLMIGLGGALSTDLSIRSIPLTAFINANAGQQLLTLEKFLQTGGQ